MGARVVYFYLIKLESSNREIHEPGASGRGEIMIRVYGLGKGGGFGHDTAVWETWALAINEATGRR